MTNPFDLSYLTDTSATLGPLAWAFLVLQATGASAGLYLLFGRKNRHSLRNNLLSHLGQALLVMGGIGILLGVLRAYDVAVFSQRYWFYLLLLLELGLAGYIAYYTRSGYPRQRAAQHQTSWGRGSTGHDQSSHPESAHSSSRRASRQRRKRKQRR